MADLFKMTRRGRVYLMGPDDNRVNPIHAADLAVRCVDALDGNQPAFDTGVPCLPKCVIALNGHGTR